MTKFWSTTSNADEKGVNLPTDFSNDAKQNDLMKDTNCGTASAPARAIGNISIQFVGCWNQAHLQFRSNIRQ